MSESNRSRIERFFAASHAGDQATMASLLHDEVEFHEAPSLPYGGVYRGRAGWTDLAAKVFGFWPDLVVTPVYLIGAPDDDRFGAMHHFAARSPVTGEAFETTVFEMWRVEDGKIREIQVHYFDTAEINRLAGVA